MSVATIIEINNTHVIFGETVLALYDDCCNNLFLGTFAEAVDRFNCNIHYNGLLHAVSQDVSIVMPTNACCLA